MAGSADTRDTSQCSPAQPSSDQPGPVHAQSYSHAREMAGTMSQPRSMVRMRMVEMARGKLAATYSRKGICSGTRQGGGRGAGTA